MGFDNVAGQEKAKRILQYALRNDTVSHAYLFSGPPGTGRMKAALAFTQALFCEQGGDDGCGQCLECRKLEHGNQPDLHIVAPEGNSIKIEQIRDLQREMAYRNAGSRRKVYIMQQTEKMTLQAANSLLKFLEEPQSAVVAILLTDNGQAVLPTIRSRTQWVPFHSLPAEELEQLLVQEGFPAMHARAGGRLASGLEACRAIIQQEGFAEIRNVVIQLGKDSLTRFPTAIITAQQQFFKTSISDRTDLLLSMLILWYKDFIHFQAGRQESIVFLDQMDWISKQAFLHPASYWVGCIERALEAGKRMRANVAPQLAFEQFLVNLQEG